VSAMSVWLGGLACLVVAVPAATRRLEPAERTRLLAGVLVRFSPVALACVLTLLVTGVAQAYIHIRSWDGLFDTAYGVAVLIKFALLMALVALGALNRQRTIPALSRAVAARRSPGEIGVLLRRTLRAEVFLVIVVLGVTSALVGYTPPVDATLGPFSATAAIGPAQLQITVDPARVGVNTIHLYLINPRDGSQFTATQELDVQASLPAKGIGPLKLTATPAGPGHYIVNSTQLIPAGTWDIQLTDRVSAFDEYLQTIEVPIR
jgi:copper transport protein